MAMQSIDLAAADWTLTIPNEAAVPAALRGRVIPARVPGCVHLDLIQAGLIEHPNIGFAELEQTWIGACDWTYRCRFVAADSLLSRERVDLRCEGLDTVCTLDLNGRRIGNAANMFHAHRFDIREALRSGENELTITFASPLRHIRAEAKRLGPRPVNGDWDPYVFIRKSACNFGWDWGPRVATAGVWRPIHLEAWCAARIAAVRVDVRRECEGRDTWGLDATVEVEFASSARASRLSALVRDEVGRPVAEASAAASPPARFAKISLAIDRPRRWWPRGYGEQSLYVLEITLETEAGDTLERAARRVGFRNMRLDTTADASGSAFTILVNDRPIFCKGANWIPDSLFPAEITCEQYQRRIAQAVDANMNMLRVWGGGIYEDDRFYDACDEVGILVWQDFMFACAMYPEESPLRELVAAEAHHATTRLSHHPCVALWCGGNECIWAHESWGFGARLAPNQTWGAAYYHQTLPNAARDLSTPYWPNSPYSAEARVAPNDADHGNQHVWDRWGDGYRMVAPRFCTEFGHQSPPNFATLRESWPVSELRLGSRAMEHRQRAGGGNSARYDVPLAEWFREPRDFDEWHFLSQLLAARSVAAGVEWWRANQPRCMGALFWQLNDVWAGHSWSAIDVAGRRKLLWYAARRALAPRLLTIQPIGGSLWLFAVNDHDERWQTTASVRCANLRGGVLKQAEVEIGSDERDVGRVDISHIAAGVVSPLETALIVDCDGLRATWFFGRDRELRYAEPRFSLSQPGHGAIRIAAETLVRDMCFQFDRLSPECAAEDQLITLLPGESIDIAVQAPMPPLADVAAAPPIVWCANWFGATR
ncbi:MAG: glycoside hydrolase family 2 protein [Phycisphaerales bacterium]|nr:glycoside hydrolase family 2 protein [Phycisphaerales bacterium]